MFLDKAEYKKAVIEIADMYTVRFDADVIELSLNGQNSRRIEDIRFLKILKIISLPF